MLRIPTKTDRLAKAAITLLCVFSIFSLVAGAQTSSGKPLDAASLAVLLEELKGVVEQTGHNESETAAVSEKWNARKDLAGKPKGKVIDLLWTDVKTTVKDSGTLYQIYSIFSFYKTIPDAPASAAAPKAGRPLSKPASVNKLIDLTYRMHPYVGIDEQLALLPGTKDIEAEEEKQRANRIEGFDAALKVNNKLTAAQKSFVTANYDHLIKMTDKITEDAIRTNFPTERWIRDGLKKSYNGKFASKELADLISYFQESRGQQFLKYARLTHMAQMITGNGGTVDLTEADKAEHDGFAATALGTKFIAAYMKEAVAYEEAQENAVRSRNPDADGFAIYRPENLNKLFNKYVAENYKK